MIQRIRALLTRPADSDDPDAERIRLDGFPGRGTVVSATPTGRVRDARREVDLELEVFIPRLRSFRSELRPWVTDAELGRLVPGQAVPVAADRAEPGHVVLAFDMDEVRSIAGLGPFAGGPGGPRPDEPVVSPGGEPEPDR